MERKNELNDLKARKKGFLHAMPEDSRRLLKMQQHSVHTAKRILYLIPLLLILFVAGFIWVSIKVPYENNWLINGIILAVLFIAVTILLLFKRSSILKKAKALSNSIPDFVDQYEQLDRSIREAKKGNRTEQKS